MNTNFPDLHQSMEALHARIFDDLRRRLLQEPPCRRLADVIESVNAMQRARNSPEEFDLRFEEFVYRAEDYGEAVRPFFPALVALLSSRRSDEGDGQINRDAVPKGGIVAGIV